MEKETALKILRELHDNALFSERTALETLIPELKEPKSDDEKMREELKFYLEVRRRQTGDDDEYVSCDRFLAWLEKQEIEENKGNLRGISSNSAWSEEDEKIIKSIKEAVKYYWSDDTQAKNDIIAWLEKQGKKSNIPQDTEDDLRRQSTIQVLEYARSLDAYNQYGKESINKDITWLEKQGEQMSDPRYSILDKLIDADDIYQMSRNDAMTGEAKNKAIEALSKLEISKLLGLEN